MITFHRCRTRLWAPATAAMIATSAGGCAWGPGDPFATVTARLEAEIAVDRDRDLGMGWQRLASDYEIIIDELVLETGEIELVNGGIDGATFDPANPPAGYSLCHNGHCHSDDGRLVDYEEIAAELSQGEGATAVMVLPVGTLDIAAGVTRDLDCQPSCDLPRANLVAANLPVMHIQARGTVRDGRANTRIEGESAWILELDTTGDDLLMLSWPLELAADRGHAPAVSLDLNLAVTGQIFDQVDWAALAADGTGTLAVGSNADAGQAVLSAMGSVALNATVAR